MTFSEQLKSQLDIVEVIGQYVRLKRSGAAHRYVGLCPFHSEKSPSFSVNAANQFYYCFGCQASGDVYKFVQEIESLTFPEVLKALAERHGIPVPERQRPNDGETQRRDALMEMHEIAATVFQNNLRGSSGTEARAYLERRGVAKSAMDEFRLGLADASGQQLAARLQKFPADRGEGSGLLRKRDSGGFYDGFRERIMFPIHTESGKVIAFGGRALRPGDNPKYLNSPETSIYKKSAVLYNMHRAKADARKHDRMILVEGYMDAIGIYAAGIREVVAVCGTALSNLQVRSIKRQIAQQQAAAGTVVLNFDPDAAGARSAEKYIAHFLAEGLRVRILELRGGLDPDEYIQQHGVESYAKSLDGASSYFHWLAERARNKFDLSTVEGRVDAFKSVLPTAQQVSDRIERAAAIAELSDALKLDRDTIARELRTDGRHGQPRRDPAPMLPPNEILLLGCFLASQDAREAIKHYLANSAVLPMLESRAVFECALALDGESISFSVDTLSNRLDARMQRIVAALISSRGATSEDDAAQQALHCLRALESKAREARCRELRGRIRELEQQGKLNEALALTTELERARSASPGL